MKQGASTNSLLKQFTIMAFGLGYSLKYFICQSNWEFSVTMFCTKNYIVFKLLRFSVSQMHIGVLLPVTAYIYSDLMCVLTACTWRKNVRLCCRYRLIEIHFLNHFCFVNVKNHVLWLRNSILKSQVSFGFVT